MPALKRLLSILTLLCSAAWLLLAASDGPRSPSANDAAWANMTNAYSQTDTYADGTTAYNVTGTWSSLGFSGLSGTIDGVLVEIDSYKTGSLNNVIDINLVNVGTCTQKTSAIMATSDTDTYEQFGGAADTWSCTSLTPTNVNSSSFGVSVHTNKSGGATPASGSWNVDHIRVTVTYTPTGGSRRRVTLVSQ